MAASIDEMLEFLEEQKKVTEQVLPVPAVPKILSFMGTTSAPGTTLDVAARGLVDIEQIPGSPDAIQVRIRGRLPRKPKPGECITASIPNLQAYKGYQVKTLNVLQTAAMTRIAEPVDPDETLIFGEHVYTIHHGPNTATAFEDIDIETLLGELRGVRYLLIGIGEEANISPRFIFHHEVVDGHLVFFHGDSKENKTFRNIERNRDETRTVVNPNTFAGYAFRGRLLAMKPGVEKTGYEKVCAGFKALGWDNPSIAYAFVANDWTPIAP